MKQKNLILILLLSNQLNAAVGCIDDSYHIKRERFYQRIEPSIRTSLTVLRNENERPLDSKDWHPVECSCPCEQYRAGYIKPTTFAEGYCAICQHRGSSTRTSLQDKEADRRLIDREFALFNTITK